MKVKDIMIKAAGLLGYADAVKAYLNGSSTSGKTQAELLLSCFNLVENELALDYIPLIKEETFTAENGKIGYAEFASSIVRILRVSDKHGGRVPFRLFAAYMEVDEKVVTVRYAYTPTGKTAEEDCEFLSGVSDRVIAFGMAAEYCTAIGLYEDARVWDKKYKEGIEAARKIGTKNTIASRRWV